MKKNVLLFGGGGYNAQEVYFCLKGTIRYNPILASSMDNHSTFIDKNAIVNLPFDSDEKFIDELNRCIDENNIDFVIPMHDTNALILMENEENINATIICSPKETARICRFKSKTYEILKDYDFIPKTYSKDSEVEYPIFVKDDIGQGGKNSFLINTENELENLDNTIDYVYCEYLPGEEITIDCFTDRFGKIRFIQPRKRVRILNGISARAVLVELTDEIKNIVNIISKNIVFRGYWFIQCKQDKFGKYKLLEISTRFAGTFNLSKNLDVNLPMLALADFEERNIEILPNRYDIILDKTYIDRYKINYNYKRVYIDFDDTIVFEKKYYNTEMMRFIYQCINKGIQLILITKHEFNILETMRNIKLSESLFDEIIVVPKNEYKYKYVNNKIESIFIDNAFIERKYVKLKIGIPTFDIVNIECLIDWADE